MLSWCGRVVENFFLVGKLLESFLMEEDRQIRVKYHAFGSFETGRFRGLCFWGVGCGCDIGNCVPGCCFEAVFS